MARSLAVYYSRKGENYMPDGVQVLKKGNTEYAAEHIAKAARVPRFSPAFPSRATRQKTALVQLPPGQRKFK